MIYAILFGILGNMIALQPPLWVMRSLQVAGGIAIPLMLLTLGVSLATLKVQDLKNGLVLSLLQSYSELALYLKLWEKQGFPASAFPPQKLRDELRKTNNDMKWWYYQSRIDSSLAVYRPFWKIIRKIITLIK